MFRITFHTAPGIIESDLDLVLGELAADTGTVLAMCGCKFISAVPGNESTAITLDYEYRNGLTTFLWQHFSAHFGRAETDALVRSVLDAAAQTAA